MVTAADFVQVGSSVGLTQRGRSAFIRSYEQRMDQLVTHPVFGYRIALQLLLSCRIFVALYLNEIFAARASRRRSGLLCSGPCGRSMS
jgi:CRISPR-associated protein Cas1